MNFFKKLLKLFFILLLLFSSSFTFVFTSLFFKDTPLEINTLYEDKVTTILDNKGNEVFKLELTKNNSVTYDMLPKVFIDALIAGEDSRFFSHNGIDLKRILASILNNLKGNKTQGASTLTQQLIKNTLLDSSKTIDRKINEIILALKLEKKLSKEDIILAYVNNIMFDGKTLGVNNASLNFFNKPISQVNLNEAALLVGVLNAPSLYNPIKNPSNCKKRMDVILDLMYRHCYIAEDELNKPKKVEVKDLIVNKKENIPSYSYSSYLDIVYKEVKEITSLSYFSSPLLIETYMDTNTQSILDDISSNKIIKFYDDNQQVGFSLIDNKENALVASLGGRNYNGNLLFNHSYDKKVQPASTIKPILDYALAIEYLDYNSKQVLLDSPYSYSNGKELNNVDHTYLGELLIEDAIGYSRNTTALKTYDELIKLLGKNKVSEYLKSINLLDVEENDLMQSYALGAYKYGVSTFDLASAYSMIANKGIYTKASTIKRIIDPKTNKVIYSRVKDSKRVLNEGTCDILNDILKNVVNKNYFGLGYFKNDTTQVYLKSGTSSFDKTVSNKYNYPLNANKDLLLAGYTYDYSFAIWSGFDEMSLDKQNYFKVNNDPRKQTHKQILKYVLDNLSFTKKEIDLSNEVSYVNIVKGTNYLANKYISDNYIVRALYKNNNIPNKTLQIPTLNPVNNLDVFVYDNKTEIIFSDYIQTEIKENKNTIYSPYKVYGDIEYVIELNDFIYTSNSPYIELNLPLSYINIKAYTRFNKAKEITSNYYSDLIISRDRY